MVLELHAFYRAIVEKVKNTGTAQSSVLYAFKTLKTLAGHSPQFHAFKTLESLAGTSLSLLSLEPSKNTGRAVFTALYALKSRETLARHNIQLVWLPNLSKHWQGSLHSPLSIEIIWKRWQDTVVTGLSALKYLKTLAGHNLHSRACPQRSGNTGKAQSSLLQALKTQETPTGQSQSVKP
eukprot:10154428-Lingulodinium_polyedra.AAC.1